MAQASLQRLDAVTQACDVQGLHTFGGGHRFDRRLEPEDRRDVCAQCSVQGLWGVDGVHGLSPWGVKKPAWCGLVG